MYNPEWERNPAYKKWIRPFKGDKSKAMCSVCDPPNGKLSDIASMGEAALKSHSKGDKHLSNMSLKEKAESSHRITSFYGSNNCKI